MSTPVRQIYIAGPMTGRPQFNYPLFNSAAKQLRAVGHFVMNPAENHAPPGAVWEDYMRMAIAQLLQCECVAVLPEWETSRGASLEVTIAHRLGMPVMQWHRYL